MHLPTNNSVDLHFYQKRSILTIMEIPIYFSFSDFEKNYISDFERYKETYHDCLEGDFLSEIKKLYISAVQNVEFVNLYEIGATPPFITLAEMQGENIISGIIEKIKSPGGYDFAAAKKYQFTFNKIISFVQDKKINDQIASAPEPEPYKEKENGDNVPYKLALLDELGVITNLNRQFPNKSDIYRILQFLTGGNIDNVKKYYNSIYGNYSGANQITEKHRDKAKELYYK